MVHYLLTKAQNRYLPLSQTNPVHTLSLPPFYFCVSQVGLSFRCSTKRRSILQLDRKQCANIHSNQHVIEPEP